MGPRHRNHEVVVLILNRDKPEIVPTSYRLDGQAPVGATLRYSNGNGVVGLRLPPIAGGPIASKQPVDQGVPLPALRPTIRQPQSASAAATAASAESPSNRGSPRRKTIPCRRR
jgi:hypothetical protein